MDAAGWDSRYATDELIWTAEPNRWLVEALGELPPGIVPDLGAGEDATRGGSPDAGAVMC